MQPPAAQQMKGLPVPWARVRVAPASPSNQHHSDVTNADGATCGAGLQPRGGRKLLEGKMV